MMEDIHSPKINHSDKLIETIQRASKNMNFDEYAKASGIDKEYIFMILKGEIEEVDSDTMKKLSLTH
ncbi:MAG TPA: hypothetical protein VHT34_09140 [Clostridia bacterium]|nr:hypothetical protein [Clostridia bacterium]